MVRSSRCPRSWAVHARERAGRNERGILILRAEPARPPANGALSLRRRRLRRRPEEVARFTRATVNPGLKGGCGVSLRQRCRRAGGYSRGSSTPSTVSTIPTTTTAAAAPRIIRGCLDWRSESAAARYQKTASPATAAATSTTTGASRVTWLTETSNNQATASTSAPTTRPEIAAALALMSNDSSHGYPLSVPEPSYSSGDDYVVEFLGFRFSFNAFDFEQRVTAAAVKLGLVEGNYLVRHWEQLSLVGGESLVYWLRKLVFRGAWLDHWVKDGRLEVAWEDETGEFAYVDPRRGDRALLEVAPIPSWHEVQFRR